jgi:hypothetical protein
MDRQPVAPLRPLRLRERSNLHADASFRTIAIGGETEPMRPVEIGLVDTTERVHRHTMSAAVAAFNIQVSQHLRRYWGFAPEVIVRLLANSKPIPRGVWPIKLVDKLKFNEGGFHATTSARPFAKVVVTPGSNDWTIDASHEMLEMLVDPGGNRLWPARAIRLAGTSIVDAEGDVDYLVEISDPCEGPRYTYEIDGIEVSDFITPDFYAHHTVPGMQYSFTGAIKAPRQVLHGGYITWVRPKTRLIEQLLWLATDKQPRLKQMGKAPDSSLREYVDSQTRRPVHEARAKYRMTHHRGGKAMPVKFQIGAGEKTPRTRYEKAHTVTYHQDGEIEREVWGPGAHGSTIEKVKAGVPIKRPAGTEHAVKNLGGSLLTGDKEM